LSSFVFLSIVSPSREAIAISPFPFFKNLWKHPIVFFAKLIPVEAVSTSFEKLLNLGQI